MRIVNGWTDDTEMGGRGEREEGKKGERSRCCLVRICLWPMTVVLPAAEVLDFEIWVLDLFRFSILGFRIS